MVKKSPDTKEDSSTKPPSPKDRFGIMSELRRVSPKEVVEDAVSSFEKKLAKKSNIPKLKQVEDV